LLPLATLAERPTGNPTMDETLKPQNQTEAPRPKPRDLDSWRGDIRQQPPAWRRRPRSEVVRGLWDVTRPLLARLGEGQSWE
jgi:hypothetical protein